MREMKDSGVEWIGEIPETWIVERLQWHLDEIKESNSPIKTTQVLSLTNKAGVIPYEDKGEQGNKAKENYDEYKLAYPDTIVANSMNILIGSVGICRYFGCVSPVYYVFKPKENELLSYLNYVFQMEQFQKELRRYANGILEIRLRLSSANIIKRYVAFPSHEEQIAISHFLDRKCTQIDALISNAQQQIEKLKAYKQSVITETVTKGLDSWDKCKLGYIASFKNGLNYNGTITDTTMKFLGVGDFKDNFVIDDERMYSDLIFDGNLPPDMLLNNGDIVFVRSNGSKDLVGRSVLVDSISYPLTFSGFCIRMRNNRTDLIDNKFLLYCFWSSRFRQALNQESKGFNIKNLNQGMLSSFMVYYPDITEQKAIIAELDRKCSQIDKLIALKQQKIEKLQQYKKSLIYEYVTGKKEV